MDSIQCRCEEDAELASDVHALELTDAHWNDYVKSSESVSLIQVGLLLVSFPVCVSCTIVLTFLVPLHDPAMGIYENMGFFVYNYLIGFFYVLLLTNLMHLINPDFQPSFRRFCGTFAITVFPHTLMIFLMVRIIGFPIPFVSSWLHTPGIVFSLWLVTRWSLQDCSEESQQQLVMTRSIATLKTIALVYALFCVYPWIIVWYESIAVDAWSMKLLALICFLLLRIFGMRFGILKTIVLVYALFCVYPWINVWYESIAVDAWSMKLLALICFPLLRIFGMRFGIELLRNEAPDLIPIIVVFGVKLINALFTSVVLSSDPNPGITIFLTSADMADIVVATYRLKVAQARYTVKSKFLKHAAFHVEFFALAEFIEVIIPLIYGSIISIVRLLPNAIYITGLKDLTAATYDAQIWNLTMYGSIEGCSVIFFSTLVWKQYGLKAHVLLYKVLTKNYFLLYSITCMWIACALYIRIDHFGYDFTFAFSWLETNEP